MRLQQLRRGSKGIRVGVEARRVVRRELKSVASGKRVEVGLILTVQGTKFVTIFVHTRLCRRSNGSNSGAGNMLRDREGAGWGGGAKEAGRERGMDKEIKGLGKRERARGMLAVRDWHRAFVCG
jgi:hypothetical protein